MKYLFVSTFFAVLLVPNFVRSQVEISVVNRTGSYLSNVEIEGQKVGSLVENGVASVTIPKKPSVPVVTAKCRYQILSSRHPLICGNDVSRTTTDAQGSFSYSIAIGKNAQGQEFLLITPVQ